jgi:hypothetical protein
MSRMVAGAWDGTAIISKSGGFGGDTILARLFFPEQEATIHQNNWGRGQE